MGGSGIVRRSVAGKWIEPLLVAALVGCGATAVVSAEAREVVGRIVSVADGDTVTLLDGEKRQHKVRLDGIDAPEKGQAFGERSKQSLSEVAYGRDARADCQKTDKYGREVCKVYVDDGDVGLDQIKRGMAWHFKRYEREQRPEDRRAYADAEVEARKAKRGLWRDPQPVPPWDFRARGVAK